MKMARKKKRGGRRRVIRVAATGGAIGAGLMAYNAYQSSGPAGAIQTMTGYDPSSGSFSFASATGLHAMLAGAAVSMVGAKLGLNRYLPKGIGL
jgi:uncharacterized membrane protein YebE (DUF533 family)